MRFNVKLSQENNCQYCQFLGRVSFNFFCTDWFVLTEFSEVLNCQI